MLRKTTPKLLRQESAADTGFVLWRCADLSGGGSSAGIMPEVWKGEAGGDKMAIRQSILHKAIFLLCGAEMPGHDHQGRGERTETGLAHRKNPGERVPAGAASTPYSGR